MFNKISSVDPVIKAAVNCLALYVKDFFYKVIRYIILTSIIIYGI